MTDLERAQVVKEMSDVLWEAHRKEHADLHESITLAREDMARRLEGMNEFRRQMSETEAKYLTRSEWHTNHESLEKQVRQLERLVWTAAGAATIIAFLLNWIKK